MRRRIRSARLAGMPAAEQYGRWLALHEAPSASCSEPFLVLVFSGPETTAEDVRVTERSVDAAGAPSRVLPVPPGAPLPDAEGEAKVVAVGAGDRFAPGALATLAAAAGPGERSLAYADEDRAGPGGARVRPFLKPAWSPFLSLTLPAVYPGAPFVIPAATWRSVREAAGGTDAPWPDAVLRAGEHADRITHVPRPLLTRRTAAGVDPLLGAPEAAAEAARRSVRRRGWTAALAAGSLPGTLRLHATGAVPPVSALLLTRDLPELLVPLGRSLLAQRERVPLDLVVVDHRTRDPRALAFLDHLAREGHARVLRDDGPFEYSRLVNLAAREATGDLLLLLNNDVEPLGEDWIETLAGAALIPGAGAAGPLLLYPDGTVQHGGVDLGVGTGVDHAGRHRPPEEEPPWVPVGVAREVSAVTGACLMIRRDAFRAAGGLDERRFPVSYSDVDLCLRLAAEGIATVYEPAARLVHHETRTRTPRLDPAEVRAFRRRWRARLEDDPHSAPARFRLAPSSWLDPWQRLPLRPRGPGPVSPAD
jgi:GT2 family glycosyltransferase